MCCAFLTIERASCLYQIDTQVLPSSGTQQWHRRLSDIEADDRSIGRAIFHSRKPHRRHPTSKDLSWGGASLRNMYMMWASSKKNVGHRHQEPEFISPVICDDDLWWFGRRCWLTLLMTSRTKGRVCHRLARVRVGPHLARAFTSWPCLWHRAAKNGFKEEIEELINHKQLYSIAINQSIDQSTQVTKNRSIESCVESMVHFRLCDYCSHIPRSQPKLSPGLNGYVETRQCVSIYVWYACICWIQRLSIKTSSNSLVDQDSHSCPIPF